MPPAEGSSKARPNSRSRLLTAKAATANDPFWTAPDFTYFFVLLERPLVTVISGGATFSSGLLLALDHAKGGPLHILVRPGWHVPELAEQYLSWTKYVQCSFPQTSLTYLASTEEDEALLRGLGLSTLLANKNAFIDEHLFYPEPGLEKVYSAVHIAQTKPFKRHHLGHAVSALALITYDEAGDRGLLEEVIGGYQSLAYVNYSKQGGHVLLGPDEVRRIVCQARCGLVLSELEGANNASAEYMLCGLPVVTTPSEGGRDVFFDPRHVRVVEPSAEAVCAAVEQLQNLNLDPLEIRQSILEKFRPHRHRLISWLCELSGQDLFLSADGNLWLPNFRDKLREIWTSRRGPRGRLFAKAWGSSAPLRPA